MLGIPLKHVFVCFAFYGVAKSLASCYYDNVKYKLPIFAVIGFQIVALFSIFKNDAAILNSVRQLTIFAIITAAIVSMIVPDYFSDDNEKDANKILPENPGDKNSDNCSTFMQELFNDFDKRFYYLAYVFYFFIQLLFLDRQIHEIEQKTGVFLNESVLWRHLVGFFKLVAEAVMLLIFAILLIPKVAWDGFFSMRYEARSLIFIYIFEIGTMVFKFTDPSSAKLDEVAILQIFLLPFSIFYSLLPLHSSDASSIIIVLYPTIIAIFVSLEAIISALYYSEFPHKSDQVAEQGVSAMKVFTGVLVMILKQHPTQLYIYRFMFNIFAICVAIFKCSIMFSIVRDCRKGKIAGLL